MKGPDVSSPPANWLASDLAVLAGQDDGVVLVGDNVEHVELQCACVHLKHHCEEHANRLLSAILAGEWAKTRVGPPDVVSERVKQDLEITLAYGLVCLS